MNSYTLFISDLHLEPALPALTQTLIQLLQKEAGKTDALYILGDFFEVWVGDDNHNEFNQEIINALKRFTANGTPIFFMVGNRDFLIGKNFAKQTGVKLLPDPTVINLYGEKVLLTHGDILCVEDTSHQRFRRFSQHPLTKKIFLALPLKLRQKIARFLRGQSQNQQRSKSLEVMDVTPSAVTTLLQQQQTHSMIHGHTHRPAIHHFKLENKSAQRIVLGAWHEHGNMLIANHNGEKKLVDIPLSR